MSTKVIEHDPSHIAQQVSDSINHKNAHPDTPAYHQQNIVEYSASGSVDLSSTRDGLINSVSTIIKLQARNANGNAWHPQLQHTYRLSEVADKTGLTAQYINNLIVRYKLIEPPKTQENGKREAYEFTEDDVILINRLKYLIIQGRPFREALEFLKQDALYQQGAKQMLSALQLWSHDPTVEAWRTVVEKIGALPIFVAREKHVLLCIDGGRMTLAQCAVELQLTGEDSVLPLLDAAYAKLGRVLMYVLRLVMDEAS